MFSEAFRRARETAAKIAIDSDPLLSAIIAEARRGTRDLYGLVRAREIAERCLSAADRRRRSLDGLSMTVKFLSLHWRRSRACMTESTLARLFKLVRSPSRRRGPRGPDAAIAAAVWRPRLTTAACARCRRRWKRNSRPTPPKTRCAACFAPLFPPPWFTTFNCSPNGR